MGLGATGDCLWQVGTAGAARGGWQQLGEAGGSLRHLWGELEAGRGGQLGQVGGAWPGRDSLAR